MDKAYGEPLNVASHRATKKLFEARNDGGAEDLLVGGTREKKKRYVRLGRGKGFFFFFI